MTLWKTTAALGLGLAAILPAHAQVGVSIEISQPGVAGRIDIGRFPAPRVVLPQPVIIHPAPPSPRHAAPPPRPEPVYLWVPPGHQRNWSRHCGRYHACGVPVYFVRDDWYHRDGPGRDSHRGRGDRDRDGWGDGGRDRGDDHDRGRGHGHGRGHER
jgi:hypothetical protein